MPELEARILKRAAMGLGVAVLVMGAIALIAYASRSQPMVSSFSDRVCNNLTICPKCRRERPRKICRACGSCDQCRAENKCGVCQRFSRQISLAERSLICGSCRNKPCRCPGVGGNPVLHEPGVARNGVFADTVVLTHNGDK